MGAKILQIKNGFPEPPEHLLEKGKECWRSGFAMWNDGTITERDLSAWTMYCEAYDEISHCDGVVARDGEYALSSQGTYSEHPALRRRRAAEGKVLRYQRLFGLIPDARKKRPSVSQGVASRPR